MDLDSGFFQDNWLVFRAVLPVCCGQRNIRTGHQEGESFFPFHHFQAHPSLMTALNDIEMPKFMLNVSDLPQNCSWQCPVPAFLISRLTMRNKLSLVINPNCKFSICEWQQQSDCAFKIYGSLSFKKKTLLYPRQLSGFQRYQWRDPEYFLEIKDLGMVNKW